MKIKEFLKDEEGIGVVEVILILVDIYTYERDVYPVFSIIPSIINPHKRGFDRR